MEIEHKPNNVDSEISMTGVTRYELVTLKRWFTAELHPQEVTPTRELYILQYEENVGVVRACQSRLPVAWMSYLLASWVPLLTTPLMNGRPSLDSLISKAEAMQRRLAPEPASRSADLSAAMGEPSLQPPSSPPPPRALSTQPASPPRSNDSNEKRSALRESNSDKDERQSPPREPAQPAGLTLLRTLTEGTLINTRPVLSPSVVVTLSPFLGLVRLGSSLWDWRRMGGR